MYNLIIRCIERMQEILRPERDYIPRRQAPEEAMESMLREILIQDLDTTELLWKFASEGTRQMTSWRRTATYDLIHVLKHQDGYRPYDASTWQYKN